MTQPIGVGVLGCGAFAQRRMFPAIARSPDLALAAVASRDPSRAREVADRYGCAPLGDYRAVLDDPRVAVVYVPLPAALHAPWTEAALRAGKHVLVEKPVATDPVRAAELVALARGAGLALVENVLFVHHAQHRAVDRLLDGGAIGELRGLGATFTVPHLDAADIRYRADLDGGALWDTGIYPMRAALRFLGPDLRIVGATLRRDRPEGVDVGGHALAATPDGIGATLSFGLDHAYRAVYELHGSTGRIVVDRAYTPPADHRPSVTLHTADGAREQRLEPDDQVARALEALVAAVRDGRAPDPAIVPTVDLLTAIRREAG